MDVLTFCYNLGIQTGLFILIVGSLIVYELLYLFCMYNLNFVFIHHFRI